MNKITTLLLGCLMAIGMSAQGNLSANQRLLGHTVTDDIDVSGAVVGTPGTYTIGAVLGTFDMSIIMKGYDIISGNYLDMRRQKVVRKDMLDVLGVSESDPMTAVPNQFRFYNYATWEVARYLRQWERVLKYANRGYDMLPLAKFYKLMIDKTISNGKMFKTENYGQAYDAFVEDYSALASTIDNWIKEHE